MHFFGILLTPVQVDVPVVSDADCYDLYGYLMRQGEMGLR
jgi:hypothetical protein